MSTSRKIAFVCQPYDLVLPPVQNSIGLWTYEVAKRLAANKGHDVTVYGPARVKRVQQGVRDGVRFRLVPPGTLLPPDATTDRQLPNFFRADYGRDYMAPLAADIGREGYDVVHVSHFSQFAMAAKAADPRVRTVLHMQCDWLGGIDVATAAPRLADIDLILGCSDFITDSIRAHHPASAARCATLHNGVDIERFTPRERDDQGGHMVVVGRVSPEKGIHLLFKAFDRVLEKHPEARLTVAGPLVRTSRDFFRPMFSDPRTQALEPLFESDYRKCLADHSTPRQAAATTMAGMVAHADLVDLYQRADLLVFPSIWPEPFGIPLVEAMACGLPVVATRGGGIPEIVEDGKTGLLVERGESGELAAALTNLLADADLRIRMGKAGRARAVAHYAWDSVVDRLNGYYDTLCP